MAAARWLRLSARGRRALLEEALLPSVAAEGSVRHCSENAALQKKSSNLEVAEENIVIPRKKTWDKLAVLQALASTVKRDITAANYIFQDDPFLIPRNIREYRLYSLSKESGKNAAKYVVDTHPEYFQRDIAEPHIPSLMPPKVELQPEEVSEEALRNQIQLRKVNASVDMYDQLLQAGTTIPLNISNSLLDLLCFYGDREPSDMDSHVEEKRESEELQEASEEKRQRDTPNGRHMTWRKNNNAERIFKLMPEKNAHSYCTMIRGMVKHRAYEDAFGMYTELLNHGFNADVYTFNALILAAKEVKSLSVERCEFIEDLLRQMKQQNVQPNLLTFNSVLKTMRFSGNPGKRMAMRTLNEMKALNIEPSLATYDHLLHIFYKPAHISENPSDIIYKILDEIEGKSFYPCDPEDDKFFITAMRICLNLKDIQLAYQLNRILDTGENRKMMRNHFQQMRYWGRFFHLLCIMEQFDVIMKWYKELVPSVFYLNVEGMQSLLQALDTANHLEIVPELWKDNQQFSHHQRFIIAEEVLDLMARDVQPLETQIAFADCAASIKSLYEGGEFKQVTPEWTTSVLSHITILFARAGRAQEAWKMLEFFKKHNRIPSCLVMNEILNCIKQENQTKQAFDLVKLAASFSLPSTSDLAKRVLEEFQLSEEEKKELVEMTEEIDIDSE
ncbi:small ribosomal subunit protein mS39 [Pogona vitticeps]